MIQKDYCNFRGHSHRKCRHKTRPFDSIGMQVSSSKPLTFEGLDTLLSRPLKAATDVERLAMVTRVRKCALAVVMPHDEMLYWIAMRSYSRCLSDSRFPVPHSAGATRRATEHARGGVTCSFCIMNTICKHTRTWVRISRTRAHNTKSTSGWDGFYGS